MRSAQRILLLVIVTSLGVAPAVAQPPAPQAPAPSASASDATKKADELFREANRLVMEKQWAEAEVKFQAAWALNPTYDVALNLGQTQGRLGKSRDAAEHLAFAVRNWPLVGKREPREMAEKRLSELRQVLTALTIHVNAPGAGIFVDGRMVGRSPLESEVFVDPGTRTIEAKLVGHEDATQIVTASKGGAQTVTLSLVVTAPPASRVVIATPPPSASAAPSSGSGMPPRSKSAPLLGAGIGLAAVGVGLGVAGLVASNNKSDTTTALTTQLTMRDGTGACKKPANASPCADLRNAFIDVGSFRNLSVFGFALGGAAAIATITYALLPAKKSDQQRVQATVTASPEGGGVVLRGKF